MQIRRLGGIILCTAVISFGVTPIRTLEASTVKDSSKKSDKSGKSRKGEGASWVTALQLTSAPDPTAVEFIVDEFFNNILTVGSRLFINVSDAATGEHISDLGPGDFVVKQPISQQAYGFPIPIPPFVGSPPGTFVPMDLDVETLNLGDGLYSVELLESPGCLSKGPVVAQITVSDGVGQGTMVAQGSVFGPQCITGPCLFPGP